jgi:hypothetical protein
MQVRSSCSSSQCGDASRKPIADYILNSMREECAKMPSDVVYANNLQPARDGHGTCIRKDACMRPRARKQLSTRVFVALPDLAHGGVQDAGMAAAESIAFTSGFADSCLPAPRASLGDVDFDRFDPVLCMPDVKHIVPAWTAGGASSRDIARSLPFRCLIASGATNTVESDFGRNVQAWQSAVRLASGLDPPVAWSASNAC